MSRRIAILTLLGCLALAAPASGSWGSSAAGAGLAKAQGMPGMATPTASVSGRNVTVSWTAPSGTTPVTGYIVRRYNTSAVEQTVLSNCSGTVTGTSCTETAVPSGTWRYSVTAVRGDWRGAESARSSNAVVAAPSLTLGATTVNSLPTTLSGNVAGFTGGQTVTFRLDNATTGTVLTGSTTPSPLPANGAATVSVTIPPGTSNGSHTVYAVGSSGDTAGRAITVRTPTPSTAVIQKAAGGDTGFVARNTPFYVYGNVTGTGSPPAGFSSLTANVATITPGATAVPMSAGSYTVNGTAYAYRSAQLTSDSALVAGSKSYSLTATDTAGSSRSTNYTATGDITAPSASNVQTTNVTGGVAGRAEVGDRIVLTFSEQIDTYSVLSGWNGTSTPVVVRLVHGGTDSIQVYDPTNVTQAALGSINLGRSDYTDDTIAFGASGTASTMVRSTSTITITLGTPSGAASTAAGPGAMSWAPSSSATDRAGNPMPTTARAESGTADIDF